MVTFRAFHLIITKLSRAAVVHIYRFACGWKIRFKLARELGVGDFSVSSRVPLYRAAHDISSPRASDENKRQQKRDNKWTLQCVLKPNLGSGTHSSAMF